MSNNFYNVSLLIIFTFVTVSIYILRKSAMNFLISFYDSNVGSVLFLVLSMGAAVGVTFFYGKLLIITYVLVTEDPTFELSIKVPLTWVVPFVGLVWLVAFETAVMVLLLMSLGIGRIMSDVSI